MTFDFSKYAVSSTKTAQYEFLAIDGTPTMTVKPATEINKPFYNALLRRSKNTARVVKARGINAEMVASNRNEDRVLFAAHVIVGWDKVVDANGKVVPFSKEECEAFLVALPDYLFDDLREFATNEGNFVSDSVDTEGTSKN